MSTPNIITDQVDRYVDFITKARPPDPEIALCSWFFSETWCAIHDTIVWDPERELLRHESQCYGEVDDEKIFWSYVSLVMRRVTDVLKLQEPLVLKSADAPAGAETKARLYQIADDVEAGHFEAQLEAENARGIGAMRDKRHAKVLLLLSFAEAMVDYAIAAQYRHIGVTACLVQEVWPRAATSVSLFIKEVYDACK